MITPHVVPLLRFTDADIEQANTAWDCNCGPSALAACLGWTLDAVRPHLGDFEQWGYMNGSMMRSAIERCGFITSPSKHHLPIHGLIRVQFTGPWTEPGANPGWAAAHTHWIASKAVGPPQPTFDRWIFDINGLWRPFGSWVSDILPLLTAAIPRAHGGWEATHAWEVRKGKARGPLYHHGDARKHLRFRG